MKEHYKPEPKHSILFSVCKVIFIGVAAITFAYVLVDNLAK